MVIRSDLGSIRAGPLGGSTRDLPIAFGTAHSNSIVGMGRGCQGLFLEEWRVFGLDFGIGFLTWARRHVGTRLYAERQYSYAHYLQAESVILGHGVIRAGDRSYQAYHSTVMLKNHDPSY